MNPLDPRCLNPLCREKDIADDIPHILLSCPMHAEHRATFIRHILTKKKLSGHFSESLTQSLDTRGTPILPPAQLPMLSLMLGNAPRLKSFHSAHLGKSVLSTLRFLTSGLEAFYESLMEARARFFFPPIT